MLPTSATRRVARCIATTNANTNAASNVCSTARPVSFRSRGGAVFAALTMSALLAACSIPRHTDAEAAPPDPFNPAATQLLDNTDWELSGWKLASGAMRDVPHGDTGEPVTLNLSTTTGQRRATGFSGCNRYTGTYSLQAGKLSFGPLAGTRMACATAGGKIEGAYLGALTHVAHSGVDMRKPQQLQLVLDDGDTLIFARRGQ